MTRLRLAIIAALLSLQVGLTSGCADSCFQIQQALCECRGQTQDERNSCENTQSQQESIEPPTSAQLATCERLLPGCRKAINDGNSCQVLQTVAGRQACGIAEE